MEYCITHRTTYAYGEAVPVSHNEVRLWPRDLGRQRCLAHQLQIDPPAGDVRARYDYFGNRVRYFCIHESHEAMTVETVSRVAVQRRAEVQPDQSPPWEMVAEQLRQDRTQEGLAACYLSFPSPRAPVSAALVEFARGSFPSGRPVLEAAIELMGRIHKEFRYDSKATTVATAVDQVLKEKRGVCQDFAHLQIACLRSLGLAASYVSGYLRTVPPPGKPRLVGIDASHAWLSVYCGARIGWVDLDPTNDLVVDLDHVTLAFGRDYGDVAPIRGVFVGGGAHQLTVAVDVEPLDAE